MNLEQGWPLVLSSKADVPSNTTQRPSQLALMNPTGEPFKIHEIRFTLTSSVDFLTGATVGCKLDLGSVAITNGFVPVWNFGRVISSDQDRNLQYSWRLKHPLYVPAGGLLIPNFENYGQTTATIGVRISYFATAITDTRPQRVFLPWVSAYIGKAFNYMNADSDASDEMDLANPFDSDIMISRLIGRINVFSASTGNNFSTTGSQLLSTRVSLSNGDPLVRTPTPFQQVFGEEGRAWEQRNTVLRPKQYFQVFIDKESTTDTNTGSTIQPYVSIVGYREMATIES